MDERERIGSKREKRKVGGGGEFEAAGRGTRRECQGERGGVR